MLNKNNSYRIRNLCIYSICLSIVYLSIVFMNTNIKQSNLKTDEEQDTTVNLIITDTNDKIEMEDDKIEGISEQATEEIKNTTEIKDTLKEESTTKVYNKTNFGVFKSYTDYKLLSRNSKQWQLQEQAYTDENGLRKIGDAYLVALGSYYGTELGIRYTVTLSNGSVFDIILCDCKQDIHTDSSNRECLVNGSVLEFYVDSSALPKKVKTMGTISAIPFFSGSVVDIVKK